MVHRRLRSENYMVIVSVVTNLLYNDFKHLLNNDLISNNHGIKGRGRVTVTLVFVRSMYTCSSINPQSVVLACRRRDYFNGEVLTHEYYCKTECTLLQNLIAT